MKSIDMGKLSRRIARAGARLAEAQPQVVIHNNISGGAGVTEAIDKLARDSEIQLKKIETQISKIGPVVDIPSPTRLPVIITVEGYSMEITRMRALKEGQFFVVEVNPKKPNGKPAAVQDLQYFTADPAILDLKLSRDGKKAAFRALADSEGKEIGYGAKADADLGEGFVPLEFNDTVVVQAALANDLGVVVGDVLDGELPPEFGSEVKPADGE